MSFDFSNINWHLKNAIPPEVSHFRNNSHPGIKWWLKTVVPNRNIDELLYEVWQQISTRIPSTVRLVNMAFDWHGNIIQDGVSIWICANKDVVLEYREDGLFDYSIEDSGDTFNAWGIVLNRFLEENHNMSEEPENSPLREIQEILEFMAGATTETQAKERRTGFKVISNESEDRNDDNN
jgi:hypothetical protein